MRFLRRNGYSLIDNSVEVAFDNSSTRSNFNPEGTTVIGTIFLLLNATLGAGLLNFPLAFDRSGGVISAIIVQLSFLIFITIALVTLANCSDITKTSSMPDTVAGLCGPKTLILCGICVTIYSFGCCLTFIIVIGDQFERVLATYYGTDYCHHWFLSRTFITCVSCTLFILPISFFKRLDILSYVSSVGCITIVYVIWVIIHQSINTPDYPKPTQAWPRNASQAFQLVPIICFAYQTFGMGHVPSDILQGYSDKSASLAIAIIAIAVKNFTTYPIVLFCGRSSLMGLFHAEIEDNVAVRAFVTLLWFILTLFAAVVISDISPVINLMGTLSATFIFIFPGICLLQSVLVKDPAFRLYKSRFLIVVAVVMTALGGFVCGLVFVQALEDLYQVPVDKKFVTGVRIGLGGSLCI
ncbi:Similar to slc38a7: Putative sodium-coupled neutral amino acid transporter 7 (Danio rerio) [Cotesia congregata]|uniref:Similar to slc38a7: Putative sodium-coupled neutral amino acid transporter 7 (Danio rerio) n=1 Tax=Cotesia congregata TaxID=51543 RepID=A0A8J2HN14_COTCN|nr:Similar to slc38a7: Putative sodium-coupled neutral amino acid transporter 7 (Danio rerio) [Cotesia congregata]